MNSFQAAGLPFVNTDLISAWSNLKLPPLKIGELLEVHRKNAAALTKANQAVLDGLRTLVQRQGELFKTTVNDCSKVTCDVLAGASLEERTTRQVDAARHVYVSSVARFGELSDIAVRTNVTAVDILNARVSEAFDELRALFAAPVAPTALTTVSAESVAVVEEVPDEDAVAAEPVAVVEEVADAVAPVEPEPTVSAAPKKAARATKARRATRRG